jgi:hypothetical protein
MGSMKETTLPRALATVLLLVSLAMLIPIGAAVMGLMRGEAVASSAWTTPLVILATGLALMSFLPRMQASGSQLYVAAFALWLLAAGYFLFNR